MFELRNFHLKVNVGERRRHFRLPVTVPACIWYDQRWYRTMVLDISHGGLLLSLIDLPIGHDVAAITIDLQKIGRFPARIVGISQIGIHVKIEAATEEYQREIQRLLNLTQIWSQSKA